MRQYDFEQSIGYWLCVTAAAMQRTLNDELAPHGLTYRQSQVIGWLILEGELTQAELAAKMLIEPPTLVGLLDRMEQQGWIGRFACPGDKRKKLVRLLTAAEEIWEQIVNSALNVRARATARLTDEETEQLRNLLRRVHATLATEAVLATVEESKIAAASA